LLFTGEPAGLAAASPPAKQSLWYLPLVPLQPPCCFSVVTWHLSMAVTSAEHMRARSLQAQQPSGG
jgi:hypothetical protein